MSAHLGPRFIKERRFMKSFRDIKCLMPALILCEQSSVKCALLSLLNYHFNLKLITVRFNFTHTTISCVVRQLIQQQQQQQQIQILRLGEKNGGFVSVGLGKYMQKID